MGTPDPDCANLWWPIAHLRGPVRIVIQMIGNLRRPEAGHIAIVDVAFDRLAKACRAAGRINLPAG